MKVKDFMINDVVYVKSGEPVRNLLKRLVTHKIGGAPIVDEDHRLIGMISDGDVLRALAPQEEMIFNLYTMVFAVEKQEVGEIIVETLSKTVDEIMPKRKLYYVHPEDALEKVMKILSRHHFKKIPVIDKMDKVTGVISRGDVIRYITKQMIEDENLNEKSSK